MYQFFASIGSDVQNISQHTNDTKRTKSPNRYIFNSLLSWATLVQSGTTSFNIQLDFLVWNMLLMTSNELSQTFAE